MVISAHGMHLDQHQRLMLAAAGGILGAAAASPVVPWQLSVLAGWDAAAIVLVASVWTFLPFLDAVATRRVATREDDSRAVVDVVMLVACLVSLVGVIAGLAQAQDETGAIAGLLTSAAVVTVFLSWFTVHSLFALRYAHLYYGDPVGGIEFEDAVDPPDYLDFVYLAFTVGMTFQVSDTVITQRVIRRTVLRHALLSYVFGTVIVGVTINVVGSLVG